MSEATPRVTVVMATYNRLPLVTRLLQQLAAQTFRDFEVVVVDDGSQPGVAPALRELELPYPLTVLEQANAGPAKARDRGIRHARGELLVMLDDDMQLSPEFLAEHVRHHEGPAPTAVFGRYRDDPGIDRMPLFERWYSAKWSQWAADYARGAPVRGNSLCTGNVSFRRSDYLAVGGFDDSLDRSEDAELGLKLEERGVRLVYSEAAYTLHGSDHTRPETFLRRAFRYGICDLRIARKHPGSLHADPWRFWDQLPGMARPFLRLAIFVPALGRLAAYAIMRLALLSDRLGFGRLALRGTGLSFGMEYFRGIRDSCGSARSALRSRSDYLARAASEETPPPELPRLRALWARLWRDIDADHGWYEDRYGWKPATRRSLFKDSVEKIGMQIAIGVRWLAFFRDARMPLLARFTARMMRHLHGCDIHWDARFAPGIMFVHGMGIAINGAARIGPRCVLAQNVTLGLGRDPVTGAEGAPTIEANCRIGNGVTLLGPITIGEGTKILPGVVLRESVAPGSIVEPPPPVIHAQVRARTAGAREGAEPRADLPSGSPTARPQ